MKLNIKALAITFAVTWGLCLLLTGIANLIWTGYAQSFLEMMASIYPGYHGLSTFGNVIVGTLYAILDGFVCGLFVGWVYNMFVGKEA